MDCIFPSRKKRTELYPKREKPPRCNIKVLRENEGVRKRYSDELDLALKDIESLDNINEISDKITTSIEQSSKGAIPIMDKLTISKPWVDEEFLRLTEERNKSTNPEERGKLNSAVKKHRDQINNEYFDKKARQINAASECRNVEEEFRLANSYSSLNKGQRLFIDPKSLPDHFEHHFAPGSVGTRPELVNSDQYPHILPPDLPIPNEEMPCEDEIRRVIRQQKDNKCQGNDKIYSEHLKHTTSCNLVTAVLLMILWKYQ